MTNTTKLSIIAALTSFAFWIPVFSIFMASRDISASTTFTLLTIYSFSVVLLEYPTGVIGDYFSHKTSVILGYLLTGAADILLLFQTHNYVLYLSFVLITALGVTLLSGSDAAYRYNILGNSFKTNYPRIKIVGTVATLFGIITGPLLYQITPVLPFILNGMCFVLAAIIMFLMPNAQNNEAKRLSKSDNIFSLAKAGLSSILRNNILVAMIGFSGVIATLAINMKWIYPMLFSRENFPVGIWGFLISSFYLARIFGTYYYKKLFKPSQRLPLLLLLICSIFILGFTLGKLGLYSSLFLEFFMVGIMETDIDMLIQEYSDDKVRASILSFTSLIERLLSGLHIALLGLFAQQNFMPFVIVTAAMVFGISLIAILKLPTVAPNIQTKVS